MRLLSTVKEAFLLKHNRNAVQEKKKKLPWTAIVIQLSS